MEEPFVTFLNIIFGKGTVLLHSSDWPLHAYHRIVINLHMLVHACVSRTLSCHIISCIQLT